MENKLIRFMVATRIGTEQSLKAESKNILQMGDLDLNLMPLSSRQLKKLPQITREEELSGITKLQKLELEKGIVEKEKAVQIVRDIAKDFPLEKGQTLSIKIPKGTGRNVGLELTSEGGKPNKVLEIVLERSEQSTMKGKGDVTKILGYKIHTGDSQKATDFRISAESLRFQGLTQTKTVLSYQKFPKSFEDLKTDPSAFTGKSKAVFYPAAGREKDIKRRYWQARQTELNQIRGGQITKAKETREATEAFRLQYPKVDFNVMEKETVSFSFASVQGATKATVIKAVPPVIPVKTKETPKIITSVQPTKISRVEITSRSFDSLISKGLVKSTRPSISSTLSRSISSSNISSRIGSSKSFSIGSSKVTSSRTVESKKQSIKVTSEKFTPSIKSTPSRKSDSSKPISSFSSPSPSSRPPVSVRPERKPLSIKSSLTVFRTGAVSVRNQKRKRGAVPFIITRYDDTKEAKGKVQPTMDFLGSSKTDDIRGLFNRPATIHGDKRTARQLIIDKRVKVDYSPTKKRRKSKSKSNKIPKLRVF